MVTDAQGWLVTLQQQKAEKKAESGVGIENLKITQPLVTLTQRFCHLPRQRHHLVTNTYVFMRYSNTLSFCFFLFSPRDSHQT